MIVYFDLFLDVSAETIYFLDDGKQSRASAVYNAATGKLKFYISKELIELGF